MYKGKEIAHFLSVYISSSTVLIFRSVIILKGTGQIIIWILVWNWKFQYFQIWEIFGYG